MLRTQELDDYVSHDDQFNDPSPAPVVLVNVFHVAPDQAEAFIAAWADDARYFKTRPGFISAQLHRGTAGSCTFLNYAVWESVALYHAAFTPELKAAYPDGTVALPHLFRRVAVPGICVA